MSPERLIIASEADRVAVASVLIKNGYTVRLGKAKIPYKKTISYYVEYTAPALPAAASREADTDGQ